MIESRNTKNVVRAWRKNKLVETSPIHLKEEERKNEIVKCKERTNIHCVFEFETVTLMPK